jgi:circadian clock protein KaiB
MIGEMIEGVNSMIPARDKAAGAGKGSAQSEKEMAEFGKEKYVLRLYVTGLTPNSTRAIASAKALCETHLKGRYDLQIIDIYQQPQLAVGEQIVAAPTLVKKLPLPLRRLVGDLTKEERVLMGLDLRPKPDRKANTAASPGSRPRK